MVKREFAEWIHQQLESASEKGRYILFVETEATADDPDQKPSVLVAARASKGFVKSSILAAFQRLKDPAIQLEIIALLAFQMSEEVNKAQESVGKLLTALSNKLDRATEEEETNEREYH